MSPIWTFHSEVMIYSLVLVQWGMAASRTAGMVSAGLLVFEASARSALRATSLPSFVSPWSRASQTVDEPPYPSLCSTLKRSCSKQSPMEMGWKPPGQ